MTRSRVVVPTRPAVVVAVDDACITLQTFDGIWRVPSIGACQRAGDVISLADIA
jgi:hypothetical protein